MGAVDGYALGSEIGEGEVWDPVTGELVQGSKTSWYLARLDPPVDPGVTPDPDATGPVDPVDPVDPVVTPEPEPEPEPDPEPVDPVDPIDQPEEPVVTEPPSGSDLMRPEHVASRAERRQTATSVYGTDGFAVDLSVSGGRTGVEGATFTARKAEIEVSKRLAEGEKGQLIGSLSASLGGISARFDDPAAVWGLPGYSGTSRGIGAGLSWENTGGLYVDGRLGLQDYRLDIPGVEGAVHARGHNASLEAGYQITLEDGWSLTPSAQIGTARVSVDRFTLGQPLPPVDPVDPVDPVGPVGPVGPENPGTGGGSPGGGGGATAETGGGGDGASTGGTGGGVSVGGGGVSVATMGLSQGEPLGAEAGGTTRSTQSRIGAVLQRVWTGEKGERLSAYGSLDLLKETGGSFARGSWAEVGLGGSITSEDGLSTFSAGLSTPISGPGAGDVRASIGLNIRF